jgi:hypothetical protein
MTGKLVQEFKASNRNVKSDISSFQNGVYIIRFNFNSEFINKRFIVQK